MNFYSMHISNFRKKYDMGLVKTANKGYWQPFVFFVYFCVTFMPAQRVSSAETCVCFANNKNVSIINKLPF